MNNKHKYYMNELFDNILTKKAADAGTKLMML